MNKRKPRILWMGEATFLNSGYGVYGRELLTRLHKTGKYEIAELGSYGFCDDVRANNIPWKYYGCMPDSQDERALYESNIENQWGAWRFEEVCLDFQPDIVIDVRDWWMLYFVGHSPLRRYFNWMIMPTIDSAPQIEQWLSTYIDADVVMAYSEFGKEVLQQQAGNSINFGGIASPAADYSKFKPVGDKEKHKDDMGLHSHIKIVGTIMRNQKRKLYPDLLEAFKKFLIEHPKAAKDVYLYLHTSYPDIGWDIPLLIKESGIGHKILCTYVCTECKHVFPSFFSSTIQTCKNCGMPSARLPSNNMGVSTEQLADIMNLFDLYVQYSICEGFGMPQVEAAACGIPVMSVDYSAMSSVVRNIRGTPIKVARMFRESETHAWRALPNNDDLVEHMYRFFSKPESERIKKGRDTYLSCRKHYTWEKVAKTWEENIDNIEIPEHNQWQNPTPNIIEPNLNIPNNLSDEEFVRWCIVNIFGEPKETESYIALRMIRDLNYGEAIIGHGGIYYAEDSVIIDKPKYHKFGREQVVQEMLKLAENKNYWEQRRVGLIKEATPKYIQFANKRGKQ